LASLPAAAALMSRPFELPQATLVREEKQVLTRIAEVKAEHDRVGQLLKER